MNLFLRNYGVATTVNFVLYALDGVTFATGVTFAAGDVKISKNGGSFANTTNLPTAVGSSFRLTLTATEAQAADIQILISDQTATQVWLDTNVIVNTYGNASAMHPVFPSNTLQLDSDATAAVNAKLGWNGTGVIGENLPATQGQIDNISFGSGGISTLAEGVTVTTGNPTGAYTNTFAFDGAYYIVEDAAGTTDFYLNSTVGSNGVCTSIKFNGLYVQSNNDTVAVFGWDWVASSWVQLGTLTGSTGISLQSPEYNMTVNMTGTNADQGKVRFRFQSTTATAVGIDQMLFIYTSRSESSFSLHDGIAQGGSNNTIVFDSLASSITGSYVNSRVITTFGTGQGQENIITSYDGPTKTATVKNSWITNPDTTTGFDVIPGQVHAATQSGGYSNNTVYVDIVNGVAGIEIGVNGTIGNPSNNMPDARSIADDSQVNSNRIEFVRSSSGITLDQDYVGFIFSGRNPVAIDLGGNDISLSSLVSLAVTGTGTSSTGLAVYDLCGLTNLSVGKSNFVDCGLVDSLTLNESGAYYTSSGMFSNRGAITDTTPEIVFNSDGISGIGFECCHHSGEYVIKGMKPVDVLEIYGNCHITLDSTCTGGTFIYAGDITITDNSTTSPTLISGVMKDTNTKVANLNDFDPANDVVANVTLVDTVTTNTDMRGTDNALLASGYTAPDNATITAIDSKVDSVLADTDELQQNQGNWLTATGFATSAEIANIPTVAEFNARTLPSASYSQFDYTTNDVNINSASVQSVFDGGDIDGYSLEQSQRLILAASAGKLSGAATSTVTIRDTADTKNRIVATVDNDGNRTAVVRDAN